MRIDLAGGALFIMPMAFPEEFPRDVVVLAGKGKAPLTTTAKDLGASGLHPTVG